MRPIPQREQYPSLESWADALVQYLVSEQMELQGKLDDKVSRAGDTMTGPLTLSGDPSEPNHAASKNYHDSN